MTNTTTNKWWWEAYAALGWSEFLITPMSLRGEFADYGYLAVFW
jgi:hypothetical protein